MGRSQRHDRRPRGAGPGAHGPERSAHPFVRPRAGAVRRGERGVRRAAGGEPAGPGRPSEPSGPGDGTRTAARSRPPHAHASCGGRHRDHGNGGGIDSGPAAHRARRAGARPGGTRPGAHPRGGGARARRSTRRGRGTTVQGPRLRLADGCRTPQSPHQRDRPAVAGHLGLRSPDPAGARDVCASRGLGHGLRGSRCRGGHHARDGRADRHCRHVLPVPRRRRVPRGSVATRRRGHGRGGRLPGRPGVGHRPSLRPRAPAARHHLRPRGRVPLRRNDVRRGLLRHLAARGHRDGPAAAAAARSVLAGLRTGRYRRRVGARQPDRRLRGRARHRLRDRTDQRPGAGGGLHRDRHDGQPRLGPGGVHVWS